MATALKYSDKPWLKSYSPGIPTTIDYEKLAIPDFLDRTTKKFPNNTALIFQGYKMNYTQLNDHVNRFASCLADFGIKKGDSVAIHLPNVIPCVVAYYAILKLGAIAVMNNPLYSDKELNHQFNDAGVKVLITLDLLANRMIALRPKTKIKQIVYTSIGDYLPFPASLLFPLVAKKKGMAADVQTADDVYRWKDMIAKYPPYTGPTNAKPDDVAMYQYTGGTTGISKGVILTHFNLSAQVQQVASWYPTLEEGKECLLGALPFFHVFGLSCVINIGIYKGYSLLLVPRPQPEQLMEAMEKFKPTFCALVPTMFIGIMSHPKFATMETKHFKAFSSGSAPLPVEVLKTFEEKTGITILEGFGMTESAPTTHTNPFQGKTKHGSIGLPLPDIQARIVDIEDRKTDVPVGSPGELIVKGPAVMQGYLNMPGDTAETLMDGWLHTGDIAKMDEEGYFFIVDRLKDMVISGGYNVYPRDIDEVIYSHPKVEEACSIGIPHPTRGEAVKVFVVLKKGETATQDEIINFCKDKLAAYKLPTEVEFREALPKNTVGKILRKELRTEELAKRKK